MKYLRSVLKYAALLGISSTQRPFNRRILITFLLYAVNSALYCAFPILEKVGFEEYIIDIYIASATVMVIIFFAIAAFKMANIFTLLGKAEDIAESSEYSHLLILSTSRMFQVPNDVIFRIHRSSNEGNV